MSLALRVTYVWCQIPNPTVGKVDHIYVNVYRIKIKFTSEQVK